MDWKTLYKERCVTAKEAVAHIKSGDRVVTGHAVGEPSYLIDAMVSEADRLKGVEIVHMVAMGKSEYAKPEMAEHFRHNALFVGGSTRTAVKEGRADYTPCFFFEVPRLFQDSMHINVAMVTVTPPDKSGYCSLGVSVDYTKAAVEAADIVIAQVNEEMPKTYGNCKVHVSQIDYFVLHNDPIIELTPPKIGGVEKQIGKNCAALIEDGDTLQLGIGAIPDAVLLFLKDKKDLGIHSEMFSDGVVDLYEAGVITNAKKKIKPGIMTAAFLMGTKRLYDFVNDNPSVEMDPVDYVNHPFIVMQLDHIVSINSCVQVDLMGQVASESVGTMQISGIGGQVDFVRGASMAEHGKSIIAISSTAAGGTISKIVPKIDAGTPISTSRNDVDYIVTEYGIAHLKGKTLRKRAEALIEIAHPDFRDELRKEYEVQFQCRYFS